MICSTTVFIFGLIVGSFLGAFSFRWPRALSIKKGRSFCPRCKKGIFWFDNIPLLSFFFLKGKCRKCKKPISFRYCLIEVSTALTFVLIYQNLEKLGNMSRNLSWIDATGWLALPYLLIISSFLIAIFIIDFEHQLLPDSLVFGIFFLTFFVLLSFSPDKLYSSLLAGFTAALFLLLVHFVTLGHGMGLGDVKFALFAGLFFGWPMALIWLFLGFLLGAIVGLFLILIGKAKFGKQIAFGPFLVASFFITLFWGNFLMATLLPFVSL